MSFRFRKRISLGGLAHINLSATGASLSVGPRGTNVNLGGIGPNRNPRATVGLPGTGLYYQMRLDRHHEHEQQPTVAVGPILKAAPQPEPSGLAALIVRLFIGRK